MSAIEEYEKQTCKKSQIKHILNCHVLVGDITKEERKTALENYYRGYDDAAAKDASQTI